MDSLRSQVETVRVGDTVRILSPNESLIDEASEKGGDSGWLMLENALLKGELHSIGEDVVASVKTGSASELSEDVLNNFDANDYAAFTYEWIVLGQGLQNLWGWLRLRLGDEVTPYYESDLVTDTEGTPRLLQKRGR